MKRAVPTSMPCASRDSFISASMVLSCFPCRCRPGPPGRTGTREHKPNGGRMKAKIGPASDAAWNNRGMTRAAHESVGGRSPRWASRPLLGAGASSRIGGQTPSSRSRLVGQTLMGAMDGTTPSADLLARIQRGELGGVIIFGGNITTPSALAAVIARLQDAAKAGGNPPLLIATDQEGGEVKRFPAGPPAASAETMGATLGAPAVRQQGRATGKYLRGVGVDVDLAPVLDVGDACELVPRQPDLQLRSGDDRKARLGVRERASSRPGWPRPASTSPGLGTAPGNTDLAVVVVPTSKAGLERRLVSFRAAVRQRRQARDGLECRVSGARPGAAAGGALAEDRLGHPSRAARIRRRRDHRHDDGARDRPVSGRARACAPGGRRRPSLLRQRGAQQAGLRRADAGCAVTSPEPGHAPRGHTSASRS